MKNIIATIALIAIALTIGLSFAVMTDKQPGNVSLGGAFTLTDQSGKTITEKDLLGKYTLVFFGFTNCPDVCPTTLMEISQVMESLGEKGKELLPVFISVDAGGDTPETMKSYLSNFNPAIIGLTGTEEQIKQVTTAYKVYYAKVDQPNSTSGYTMDHSAFIYFMDRDGKYITHLNYKDPAEKIISTLKPYLEK
jgi:protein SCO1/2